MSEEPFSFRNQPVNNLLNKNTGIRFARMTFYR